MYVLQSLLVIQSMFSMHLSAVQSGNVRTRLLRIRCSHQLIYNPAPVTSITQMLRPLEPIDSV